MSNAENTLLGDSSHTADLQRVILAEGWSKLALFERVQFIAEQINDPNLKDLALRYAGIIINESQYDQFDRPSKVCASVSEQGSFDEGLKILTQVLKQVSIFEERFKSSCLKKIVDTYSNLMQIFPNSL